MRDILSAETLGDLTGNQDQASCEEIKLLYNLFQSLISDRKFSNNDFMQKPDALAVIDLAEACDMYETNNFKAAGVCYNNMANIQLKNGKYSLAEENFKRAIEFADRCLKDENLLDDVAKFELNQDGKQQDQLVRDLEANNQEPVLFYSF